MDFEFKLKTKKKVKVPGKGGKSNNPEVEKSKSPKVQKIKRFKIKHTTELFFRYHDQRKISFSQILKSQRAINKRNRICFESVLDRVKLIEDPFAISIQYC